MPKKTKSNSKSAQTAPTKYPVRRLTVRGGLYDYQHRKYPTPPEVPHLELRGYWLKQAGFDVGSRVKVEVRDGCLLVVGSESV